MMMKQKNRGEKIMKLERVQPLSKNTFLLMSYGIK